MIALLIVLACAKEVPPHLRPEPEVTVTDAGSDPLTSLIGTDPLVRRPDAGLKGQWETLPQGAALEAWASLARMPSALATDWLEIETAWPGSIAVPLSRGARLAAIEVAISDTWNDTEQRTIASWLGVSRVDVNPTTDKPRAPLDWITGNTLNERRQTVRHLAERMVLAGWLDGPDIDIKTVALALSTPAYTGLASSPLGALILARARNDVDESAHATGLSSLNEATMWALYAAGSDSDAEQAAYRSALQTRSTELMGADPMEFHLDRARSFFTSAAGDEAAMGLALVGITAERMFDQCADPPCGGVDRVSMLSRASRWHPSAEGMAHLWRIVFLKRTLDTFEAAHDKPGFGTRLPTLLDTLSGMGGGPVELPMLRYRDSEPTMLMQLARMANGKPSGNPEDVLSSLHERLSTACQQVEASQPIALHQPHVGRICARQP